MLHFMHRHSYKYFFFVRYLNIWAFYAYRKSWWGWFRTWRPFCNFSSRAQQHESVADASSSFIVWCINTEIITFRVSVEIYPILIINIMKIYWLPLLFSWHTMLALVLGIYPINTIIMPQKLSYYLEILHDCNMDLSPHLLFHTNLYKYQRSNQTWASFIKILKIAQKLFLEIKVFHCIIKYNIFKVIE